MGMKATWVKCLKALDLEKTQVKRLFINAELAKAILSELAKLNLGLSRFSGQVSVLYGCDCAGVYELLFIVNLAQIADR